MQLSIGEGFKRGRLASLYASRWGPYPQVPFGRALKEAMLKRDESMAEAHEWNCWYRSRGRYSVPITDAEFCIDRWLVGDLA